MLWFALGLGLLTAAANILGSYLATLDRHLSRRFSAGLLGLGGGFILGAALLEMGLDAFAMSGICREVGSGVLGEKVIFAGDDAAVPADTPLVVYRGSELRELVGGSPEDEDGIRIPSSALLENGRDHNTCYACGQSRWWTKKCGERMCAVCHPSQSTRIHVDDIK